jgi:pyroglutamyl-peptidase
MKTLLLTGFGPFGEISENPSSLLVNELRKSLELPDGFRLITEILPVIYDQAGRRIRQLIRTQKPDILISFGVAASRNKINLERVALNLQDAESSDNADILKQGQMIEPQGPKAYFANLPLHEMKSVCEDAGGLTVISNHAGGYICNEVFYAAAHEIESLGLGTRYGFIHLPELAETTQTELEHDFDLPMLTESIRAGLHWLLAQPM